MFNLLLILIILVAITACDKRSLDPNTIQLTRLVSVSDKNELYEDNGANWIDLIATVKDNNGFPVLGQSINFRCDNPNISFLPARAISDSSGQAKSQVFVSGNILNGADSLQVTIYAYLGTKIYLTKEIVVRKYPNVERIVLQGFTNMTLDVNSIIDVTARVIKSGNEVMPNGTLVTFQTNGGYFIDEDNIVSHFTKTVAVKNGVAAIKYCAGTISGKYHLTAFSGNVNAENEKTINVKAGTPKLITCQAYFDGQPVNQVAINTGDVDVKGKLTDEWSNPISGRIVNLVATKGQIHSVATTDSLGGYSVKYSPGLVSGVSSITATCDSASYVANLLIYSDSYNSLSFVNTSNISLSVQGSSGNTSAIVQTVLKDNNGNVIQESGNSIKYQIVNNPGGVQLNNSSNPVIVSTDNSGTASVSLSSGNVSGIIVLKATRVDQDGNDFDPLNPVYALSGNIVVQAGPPNSVAITTNGHDNGTNVGAGMWRINLGAVIKDRWGNPVNKNTSVFFSLTDETIGMYGDSLSIVANSFVGNDMEQDSTIAYTTLTYHGSLSNLSVGIKAEVGYYDSVNYVFDSSIILPMQNITLEIISQVGSLPFWPITLTQVSTMLITTVRDQQNNPIRNVPLIFTADKGLFYDGFDIPEDEDTFAYTGITNYNGFNQKKYTINKYECLPSPQPPMPQETSIQITVRVLGQINKLSQLNFNAIRYDGN